MKGHICSRAKVEWSVDARRKRRIGVRGERAIGGEPKSSGGGVGVGERERDRTNLHTTLDSALPARDGPRSRLRRLRWRRSREHAKEHTCSIYGTMRTFCQRIGLQNWQQTRMTSDASTIERPDRMRTTDVYRPAAPRTHRQSSPAAMLKIRKRWKLR